MSEVFIVTSLWGTPEQTEIVAVYTNGLDALMYDAGRVQWTAADDLTDDVLFTGLTNRVDQKYRIERWEVQ